VSDVELKTLADLEWDQIERAVADRCRGPLRDKLSLPLARTFEETERALAEATEAWKLLDRGEPLPLDGICDIGPSLQHLQREGVLEGNAFRDIRMTLRASATLRKFLSQRKSQAPYARSGEARAFCRADSSTCGLRWRTQRSSTAPKSWRRSPAMVINRQGRSQA